MLKIDDQHRLVGDEVSFQATPNMGGVLRARYLVMHYTAGRSLESSVASLRRPDAKASAHLVLGRDGRIVQLVPFNRVAWHAGVSAWNGLSGLNQHSIGIEMDNAGALDEVGGRYLSWFRQEYPASEVQMGAHKHGGPVRAWHAYTGAQIERALELAELLVAHYRLDDVLGHEDIAPGRKTDPGPAFPLEALRAQVAGRQSDRLSRWVVSAASLNIRRGPGAQYDPVAPALQRGTELLLIEPGSRWNRVEVVGSTDLEGWVSNAFLAPAPPPARAARRGPAARSQAVGAEPSGAEAPAEGRVAARQAAKKAAKKAARTAATKTAKETPKKAPGTPATPPSGEPAPKPATPAKQAASRRKTAAAGPAQP